MRIRFGVSAFMAALVAISTLSTVGCSRETSVYPDPAPGAPTSVELAWTRYSLPKNFANHSVGRAVVTVQAETPSTAGLRFQTWSGSNAASQFHGPGLGSRALLGLSSWNSRPVPQAEPLTFDAKSVSGNEAIGVSLQIDLACDGATVHVVHARGADVAAQSTAAQTNGFVRYTASIAAPIWLSTTGLIADPDTSASLVPTAGAPVSLTALLAKYSSACLKNVETTAADLPRGIPTSGILWSLGTDSTTSDNAVTVRRFSVGSEIYEGLE